MSFHCMNRLKPIEIKLISSFFEKKTEAGYVLDFSNRTFSDFFELELGINIDAEVYANKGTSKLNRLRTFFQLVDDHTAARALRALVRYRESVTSDYVDALPNQAAQVSALISRLENGQPSTPHNVVAPEKLDSIEYAELADDLNKLHSLPPQKRGLEFEGYLFNLFAKFGLKPHGQFRNTGEQIDGSFELDHEIYLLEAKWLKHPVGSRPIGGFQQIITQKPSWTRGLFVSFEGFTDVGMVSFGTGNSIICATGEDIYSALRGQVRIDDLLRAKVRASSQSGRAYVPFSELFSKPNG